MVQRKVSQQPKLKLYYFDMRGKGEPIRLFCKYAGLAFEDYRFTTSEEFNAQKQNGSLPFGQIPMLEVDGEHKLVQAAAILRYLSKIAGMYSDDPILAAKMDAVLDQENDAFMGITAVSYNDRFGIALSDEAKAGCFETLATEIMPKNLALVERLLKASKSGFLAGSDEPSPADFVWFCRFEHFLPAYPKRYPPSLSNLEDFPACRAFVKQMRELEAVKQHYAEEGSK